MRGKYLSRFLILVVVGVCFWAFQHYNLGQWLTLESLKAQREALTQYYNAQPFVVIGAYLGIYIVSTALSFPGATILTLAGGAIFGFWIGLLLVSVASTTGATLAFLAARFILKDSVQKKFSDKLTKINEGIEKEGAFYLFTLRLVPVFPFFAINLIMGLTPIKVSTFFFISQLGMLPGTAAYVNAGTQLSQIESLKGILSPGLLASFAIIGLLPLISKKVVAWLKQKKAPNQP